MAEAMLQQDLDQTTAKIILVLNELNRPFAFTGGLAAITYGDPRTTRDVDIILEINPWEKDFADILHKKLEDDFYFSTAACKEGIEEQTMFQAINKQTMFKVDFRLSDIVPGALERRKDISLRSGQVVPMVIPEDAILSKLVWIKLGSGISKKDIVAILRVQENLDYDYLNLTAKELGVREIFDELKIIADGYDPKVVL